MLRIYVCPHHNMQRRSHTKVSIYDKEQLHPRLLWKTNHKEKQLNSNLKICQNYRPITFTLYVVTVHVSSHCSSKSTCLHASQQLYSSCKHAIELHGLGSARKDRLLEIFP